MCDKASMHMAVPMTRRGRNAYTFWDVDQREKLRQHCRDALQSAMSRNPLPNDTDCTRFGRWAPKQRCRMAGRAGLSPTSHTSPRAHDAHP